MPDDQSPGLPQSDDEQTHQLIQQLQSDDDAIRTEAAFQLAELGDDRAVGHLLTWEPQYRVRRAAEAMLAQ